MTRTDSLNHIASTIEDMIRECGRRQDIIITFATLNDESISDFSDWNRKYHHLYTGEEVFCIWEMIETEIGFDKGLLYAVDVSGDSLMTAAGELMDLVSRKF